MINKNLQRKGVIFIEDRLYYSADEIVKYLEISKATAYRIIKQLNEELSSMGYITLRGKVSKRYFDEKYYA